MLAGHIGMNRIERSFAKVRGRPCWGVTPGVGSFLTLEFGAPRLVVREPISPATAVSARVRRLLGRRRVWVCGRWHLWIYCCDWDVVVDGRIVGGSTTKRRMARASRELDGQRLVEVRVKLRGARTRFVFDLGAELETRPYDRSSEQWLLYEPDGHVLALRADRKYSYGVGDRTPREGDWRTLTG
jgi:hypothetical protein